MLFLFGLSFVAAVANKTAERLDEQNLLFATLGDSISDGLKSGKLLNQNGVPKLTADEEK